MGTATKRRRATWIGGDYRPETRPVQTKRPTAEQVAQTVVAEMADCGYMVSFYGGDVINDDQALLILARAVLKAAKADTPTT